MALDYGGGQGGQAGRDVETRTTADRNAGNAIGQLAASGTLANSELVLQGQPTFAGGSNLPFDERIMYSSSPMVPQLARGWAQYYDPERKALGPQKFYFMFNPNEVNVSYNEDPNSRPDVATDTSSRSPTGPSFISYRVQLLFDRTYEVAYDGDRLGVQRDVKALENVLRVSQLSPYLNRGTKARWVLGTDIVIYGYVSSFSVQYARFNQDMIPMYAGIDISIMHFPSPGQNLAETLNHRGYGERSRTRSTARRRTAASRRRRKR